MGQNISADKDQGQGDMYELEAVRTSLTLSLYLNENYYINHLSFKIYMDYCHLN